MGLSDKKAKPTKEITNKLFAGRAPIVSGPKVSSPTGGGKSANNGFQLKNQESGLMRSADVFNGGQAFGNADKNASIIDWDAMAAHARENQRALTWPEMVAQLFSQDGSLHVISRPLLIALVSGIIGGIFVSGFSYYTERIQYEQFSDKGNQLLQQKEARPAVEYFLSQSNRSEIDTWSGSPSHIASLEGLAQAYANDKCYASADETFKRVIGLSRHARFRDDVRLAGLLDHYGVFLSKQDKVFDAKIVRDEVQKLHQRNQGGHWIWFFAIIAFAFEALYMTAVILDGKSRADNWPIYAGFTIVGMVGMTIGMFLLGAPVWGALAISLAITFGFFPIILAATCAMSKNCPAFHVILPSSKRK